VVRASDLRFWTRLQGNETHFRYWLEVGATTPTSGLQVRTLANSTSNISKTTWPGNYKLGMHIGVYGFYVRFESQGHVTSGSGVMGVKNCTSDSALHFEPTFHQEGQLTWRWNLFTLMKHYWEENICYRFRKFNSRISRNLRSKLIVFRFFEFLSIFEVDYLRILEFLSSCTYWRVYSSSTIASHTTFPRRLSFFRYSSSKLTPIDFSKKSEYCVRGVVCISKTVWDGRVLLTDLCSSWAALQ